MFEAGYARQTASSRVIRDPNRGELVTEGKLGWCLSQNTPPTEMIKSPNH